jgi:hypothetical protein
MRSFNFCFASEWWNVVTNAACLTIPLVITGLIMASYTTWQQKALACLFLFPIVLLSTAAFSIYCPKWTRIVFAPQSVTPPLKTVEHDGAIFVVYRNEAHRMEVDEEKVLGIFKFKRYVAGSNGSDEVVVTFPNSDFIDCSFRPSGKTYLVAARGAPGSGILETFGFRRK